MCQTSLVDRNLRSELIKLPIYKNQLKKYVSPDLLVIDEFGLKKLVQTNVDDLYEVISKRFETFSTIITFNKQLDECRQTLNLSGNSYNIAKSIR